MSQFESCILEFEFVEGKENSKKYTQELEADLEKKSREIRNLKEKNALQEKENYELKEKIRVEAAEKEKLDIKILKTERRNIKLLCEIKATRKISSDREKEIQKIKTKYLNLKKQQISDTKTFLEICR